MGLAQDPTKQALDAVASAPDCRKRRAVAMRTTRHYATLPRGFARTQHANYALGLGLAAWYVIGMRKMAAILFAFAVIATGCSEPGSGDGGSGTGGRGGSGGSPLPPPPQAVDQTCRDWCANEPVGPSCHQGPFESVKPCYEQCLRDYQNAEADYKCGDDWIAIKDCQVDLDCEDLFGDCAPVEDEFDDCVRLANNRAFCEANCPEFDPQQCSQDTSECQAYLNADQLCASRCPLRDRALCIQEVLTTGTCDPGGMGGNGGSGGVDSTFAQIQQQIFEQQGCTASACHGEAANAGLDLRPENAYANLINVEATSGDYMRVFPGEQDLSVLYLKVAAKTEGFQLSALPNPISGGAMPVGDGVLSGDDLALLRGWIRAGAPVN